jgi:hypothetical protein
MAKNTRNLSNLKVKPAIILTDRNLRKENSFVRVKGVVLAVP